MNSDSYNIRNEAIVKRVFGQFYPVSAMLNEEGYSDVSLKEVAKLRLANPDNEELLNHGSWVIDTFFNQYSPTKHKAFLTRSLFWTELEEKLIPAYYKNRDYLLRSREINAAFRNAIYLDKVEIPTLNLAEEYVTSSLFPGVAKEYGYFLNDHNIPSLIFFLPPFVAKNHFILRPTWIRGVDKGSQICLNRSRGILEEHAVLGIKYTN